MNLYTVNFRDFGFRLSVFDVHSIKLVGYTFSANGKRDIVIKNKKMPLQNVEVVKNHFTSAGALPEMVLHLVNHI